MSELLYDKRRQSRAKFAYPVTFTLFFPGYLSRSYVGYLKNMSVGGVCIRFEDRYGRIELEKLNGSLIKLTIKIPQGKKIVFDALVHWIRMESPEKSLFVLMGLELMKIEDWQLKQIEKFINLKNKDHKMLWNLFEYHLQLK